MKKSSIFILTLSIILILFVAVACSNETAVVNDQLAYVSFGQSGSRSFTTGLSSVPGEANLFWEYTAVKTDGKLNTGAGTVRFNETGITNKTEEGPFSVGEWKFTLKAYAEQNRETLVYEGVNNNVTLNAGRNNVIDVDVIYQPKGGNGTLTLDNVYVKYTGTNELKKLQLDLVNVDSSVNPNSYQYIIENPTSSEGYKQFSLVNTESMPTNLLAGVYEAKFSFFTSDDILALPPFIQNIVILNNRVTTVSGCITEDQAIDQTFTVNTKDYGYVESAGKYYVYVNDESALQNALNAAGENEDAVVVLTCDIETENIVVNSPASTSRAINVGLANNVTIDLNGFNLNKKSDSSASELIKMNAPERILTITNSKSTGKIDAGTSTAASVVKGTLVITGGEVSGSTAVKVSAGASAEISGGKLVGTTTALVISMANAEDTAASVVISGNAEITVTGTEGTIAIKNGGDLEMTGGNIKASTAIEITSDDSFTAVLGGKIEATTSVSASNGVDVVDVVITGEADTGSSSIDDSIKKDVISIEGKGTIDEPYCVKSFNEFYYSLYLNDNVFIKLKDNIIVPEGNTNNIYILNDSNVNLDLNSYSIKKENATYSDNIGYIFNVYGHLTICDSSSGEIKGTIGGNLNDNPSNRIIQVFGDVIIKDGITIQAFSTCGGSAIYLDDKAKLEIYKANVFGSYYAIGTDSNSEIIIHDGTFASIATNKFKPGYAYTIASSGSLIMDGGEVYGAQGAIAVRGECELSGDVKAIATKELLNYMPNDYSLLYNKYHSSNPTHSDEFTTSITDSEVFYALYCAGEAARTPIGVVNGGYYESSRTAVYVGNSNDGGLGNTARLTINGGTFIGEVTADQRNPNYGVGFLTIKGGTYNKDSVKSYLSEGCIATKKEDKWVVDELNVRIGSTYYKTLDDAINTIAENNADYVTINLKKGTFLLTNQLLNNRKVVFEGEGNSSIFDLNCQPQEYNADIIFRNVHLKCGVNGGYQGIQHLNSLVFENCTFEGTLTLYGNSIKFSSCTFNNSNDYSVWTWGGRNISFNNCEFKSGGKALLLYGGGIKYDTPILWTKLTVNNCKFYDNNTLNVEKAAIEIGNDYNVQYGLVVLDTTVNGFAINPNGISTNTTLWANKNSMTAENLRVQIGDNMTYGSEMFSDIDITTTN